MNKLVVSSSPHIRSKARTNRIMLDVVIALMPAAVMGTVIFGLRALIVLATCVAGAVLAEFLFNIITKKEQTVGDFSAVVTGLLLGLNLHANAPIWQCALGSVFAIVVVKCLFGGLGCNFANPAITARIFLLVCFTGTLAGGADPYDWSNLGTTIELTTGATPLAVISKGGELPTLLDMFLGYRGGAIGETCIAALLVGFIYLVVRRVIHFETPLIFIGTVFVLALVKGGFVFGLAEILAGGVFLGAILMATDYVTTPQTPWGRVIFGIGCGLITCLIRFFGNYPEGVSFSILLMNILTPYISNWTAKKPLGGVDA